MRTAALASGRFGRSRESETARMVRQGTILLSEGETTLRLQILLQRIGRWSAGEPSGSKESQRSEEVRKR